MWERFHSPSFFSDGKRRLRSWSNSSRFIPIEILAGYVCVYICICVCVLKLKENRSIPCRSCWTSIFPIRWPSVGHPQEGALANHPYRNRSKQSKLPIYTWLVVEPPLLKHMSQLGWWHSQLNGKIKKSCSKPPTSLIFPSFFAHWIFGFMAGGDFHDELRYFSILWVVWSRTNRQPTSTNHDISKHLPVSMLKQQTDGLVSLD